LGYPLERWHNHPILSLPYFEQIFCFFKSLANGNEIELSLFIKGNGIANAQITESSAGVVREKMLGLVAWIGRCRAVAKRYGVNPRLPDLNKISDEEWETVDDLFALLSTNKVIKLYPGFSADITLSGSSENKIELPVLGCIRLDGQDGLINILGSSISAGPLRHIFTNSTIESSVIHPDGTRTLRVKGNDTTLRIVERF
jgi:hypothetical protein